MGHDCTIIVWNDKEQFKVQWVHEKGETSICKNVYKTDYLQSAVRLLNMSGCYCTDNGCLWITTKSILQYPCQLWVSERNMLLAKTKKIWNGSPFLCSVSSITVLTSQTCFKYTRTSKSYLQCLLLSYILSDLLHIGKWEKFNYIWHFMERR